jgi:hypothetical protein
LSPSRIRRSKARVGGVVGGSGSGRLCDGTKLGAGNGWCRGVGLGLM